MTVASLLVLAAIAATPAKFSVQPLEGASFPGVVESLDAENLTLKTEAGSQKLPFRELLTADAENVAKPARVATSIAAELHDGSVFNAKEFMREKDSGWFKLADDRTVEVPMRALRFVRFKDPNEKSAKLDTQWKEIVGGDHASDLLVVRKKGVIDFTEGVVGNITGESVMFTLDGDEIKVNREKIEGLVFAKTPAELPEAVCAVSDAAGKKINAKIVLDGDTLEATTQSGVKFAVPFVSIMQLDFSSGKFVFLSDLEPESFVYQPFFAAPTELPSLGNFYHLRRDAGIESPVIKLDGKAYPKGIALHSRSKVVYKLPGKFRKFTAMVGIDDEARDGGGDVALEISGDGESLYSGKVRGADPARALELDLTGVRKLEIVVDYGDGQDVADHLDLAAAKVTK